MPRVEFDTFDEAKPWLNKFIKNSDKGYVGYYTANHELVLTPTRSTQPIVVGYIKSCSESDVNKFGESAGIDVFRITKFEFDSQRGLSKGEN